MALGPRPGRAGTSLRSVLQGGQGFAIQREPEQPVRKPRVQGQNGAMQVRPDDPILDRTLGAVEPVVAASSWCARERLGAGSEPGASGVVLETDQGRGETFDAEAGCDRANDTCVFRFGHD